MPALSHRSDEMPSSPIRKLAEYAADAEKRGVRVHYLNIGQPDVESPKAFWQAVRNPGVKVLEYSHSAGTRSLREAVARRLQSRGQDVLPEDVFTTNGGSEATLFTFMVCLDPGDELLVLEPLYANYVGFAVEAGVKLVPLTSRVEDDFALPSPEEIGAAIGPRTKGILLCNPSNPTGTVYPRAQLEAIAKIALERDAYLIVDEVYRDYYYGSEQLVSVLSLPGMERHAIMLDSVSKCFSLCGARVGFLVSRNAEVVATALKLGQARLSPPTLDTMGVEACYRECGEDWYHAIATEFRARRDALLEELSRTPGVVCPKIEGAFYAMVKLPVDDADAFCQWMMTDFQHKGETTLLAPGSGFYVTPGLGKQEARIAYVLKVDRLRRALTCLREGLAAYPGRV